MTDPVDNPSSDKPSLDSVNAMPPDALDLDQAAAQLGVHPADLHVTIREGRLPAAWIPSTRTWYVRQADIDAYLAANP